MLSMGCCLRIKYLELVGVRYKQVLICNQYYYYYGSSSEIVIVSVFGTCIGDKNFLNLLENRNLKGLN